MRVLVYIEQRHRVLKKNTLEVLSLAKSMVQNSADLSAVVVGKDIAGIAEQVRAYNLGSVYVVEGDEFEHFNALAYSKAVEECIRVFDPQLVLGAASPIGRDLFPRLAARFDGGIVTDAVAVSRDGDNLVVQKPMYAGKCIGEFELSGATRQFLTIRPNVFPVEPVADNNPELKTLSVSVDLASCRTVEVRKGESERPDLTEASVIVSGGRALKNSENFKIIEACADVLGAAVGASRAAVDAGYRAHSAQVGQTGKTVTPNLYIACGISGAIQHLAGMRTSKVILAINNDPDAPIFNIADYGIVGDLFEVVPALTEKLKSIL